MPAPANRNDMQPKKAPEGGVQLQDLKDRMCKWPHGDPQESDFHFCGGPSVPGLPYCEEHVKAAYQTNKKSKILNPEAFENNNKDSDEDEQEQLA